jgi:hypothetical protein
LSHDLVLADHTLKKTRHLISATTRASWHDELNAFGGLPIGLSERIGTERTARHQGNSFKGHH